MTKLWPFAQRGIAFYGSLTLAYLVARLLLGERWGMVGLANNFIPCMAGISAVGAIMALFSRQRRLLIALQLPAILLFGAIYGARFWPARPATLDDGDVIDVVTYNILSKNSNPQAIIETLTALDADIVGLQELGPEHATLLRGHYPYQALHPSPVGFGLGLLSRYPIIDERVLLTYRRNAHHMRIVLLRAVLDVHDTRITVYVAHPVVPYPIEVVRVGALPVPLSPYDDSRRDQQLATLRRYIASDRTPVLVLCDCNMTDQSDAYHAMDRLLDDAFREAGWGLGFTSTRFILNRRVLPRFARIDYIWHSTDFAATRVEVVDDHRASDHFPVAARLAKEKS